MRKEVCILGSLGQKVQIWKVQIFGERSFLMKCSLLYGCLNGNIQFLIFDLIFENFDMVLMWGQSFGINLGF